MTRTYLLGRPELGYTPESAATTVPDPRPGRFLRLMLSGSERRTIVHRDTRITIECWNSAGEAAAAHDAELVYMAMDAWDLVPDFDGFPSGPYTQPDPETGTPRYVMTCLVRHRMENP